jgi:ABC-type glucose/galactose transport system permease subunit
MKKDKRLKRRNRWFLAMLTSLVTAIVILLANLTQLTFQTTPDDFFYTIGTKLQTIPMIPNLANTLPQGQVMIDIYTIEWVLIEAAITLALIWLMYNRFQHHRKQHHKEEKARYVKNL